MGHDHDHATAPTDPGDAHVCVCFHVPRRKIETFCRREKPRVISLISDCLGAGTGCGWCIPFLKAIHAEMVDGGPAVSLPDPDEYLRRRKAYHREKGINRP